MATQPADVEIVYADENAIESVAEVEAQEYGAEESVGDFYSKIKDTEFSEDRVLVIMKHEYSGINKVFTTADFPELRIESVEDLTAQPEGTTPEDFVDWSEFRQVLSLKLVDKSNNDVKQAIKKLEKRADEDVYFAQPDYHYQIETNIYPDDTNINSQMGYYNLIGLPQAWDIETGNEELQVAVMDNYVEEHEDLEDNLYGEKDYTNGQPALSPDKPYHGTACSSVIGAKGNNEKGYAGVCWDIRLVSLVIPSNTITTSVFGDIIEDLHDDGIEICSCSWSYIPYNSSDDYVDRYDVGIRNILSSYQGLFIWSAGNYASNGATNLVYPGAYDCSNILTVAASDIDDNVATFSNYNSVSVDIFAPGVGVPVIGPTSNTDPTLTYTAGNGTSYSAPMVAGVAALVKSANPLLTPLQIKAIILNNSDIKPAFVGKCTSNGRLNAYKAVQAAINSNGQEFLYDANTETYVKYVGTVPNITIPVVCNGGYVTKIGDSAFEDHTLISSVSVSVLIESIGNRAFRNCPNLTSVTLQSSVEDLGMEAFMNCTSLENVVLSNAITEIKARTFAVCMNLESITLPNNLISIGNNAFHLCVSLSSVQNIMNTNLESFGTDVFLMCSSLKKLEIPNSVISIGTGSFPTDDNFLLYIVSNSYAEEYADLNDVSYCSFSGNVFIEFAPSSECTIKEFDIPMQFAGMIINSVAGHAFDDVDVLEIINVPITITTIGYRAFRNCDELKLVTIPDSVTSFSNSMNSTVFEGSPKVVVLTEDYSEAEYYAYDCEVTCVSLGLNNNKYSVNYCDAPEGAATQIYLPEQFLGKNITSISGGAFEATNITSIVIPSTVTNVGNRAFANCESMVLVKVYSMSAAFSTNAFAGIEENILMYAYANSVPAAYAQSVGIVCFNL